MNEPKESFAAMFESAPARIHRRTFRRGERLEATVVSIGRDAVFVDLGAKLEGFFELPDVLDERGEVIVKVGASISAIVASYDNETGQVRLVPAKVEGATLVATKGEAPLLVEGSKVHGKIVQIERYGLFVQIDGTQGRAGRGLVPVSETATPRGSDLKKTFTVGQEVDVKILTIEEGGKIRMSIGALSMDAERKDFNEFSKKDGGGAPKAKASFGTLGDLFKGKV